MEKILVVDNDAQLLIILKESLEKINENFQVVTAINGLAAIKALQREPFSVVVTDIRMPKVNGLVLMAYMGKSFPKIPCIVMTGHGTPFLKKRLQQEAAYYLEKPFDVKELAQIIASVLEKGNEQRLGGTINGISLAGFVHLIEMESLTCVCEIRSAEREKGHLLFEDGILINALFGNLKGERAAIELLRMKRVTIRFRKPPKKRIPRRIIRSLTELVAAAMNQDNKAEAQQK